MGRFVQAVCAAYLLVATAAIGGKPPPVISLIIDDLGDRHSAGLRAIRLPGPVAVAVIPGTAHARELAVAAHAAGKEVLVHMPMQATRAIDPGQGALLLDMDRQQVHAALAAAIRGVPHATGMNNHMGSLITQHPGHMAWLMELLHAQTPALFFVDSRTSAGSVAIAMAEEAGVGHLQRDVFLDHARDPASIVREFRRLLARALNNGAAVGIGHPYPETLEMLERELPGLLKTYGVELVPLAQMPQLQSRP